MGKDWMERRARRLSIWLAGAQGHGRVKEKVKAWERVVQSSAHPVQGRLAQHWGIQLLPFLVFSDQLAILF